MRVMRSLITGAGCALIFGTAAAAVSQQEADQLGKNLTPWGAEQAGSADHVIPEYSGGLPVNTDPSGWKKDSHRYDVGPYDGEKPLFSINAANAAQYASHLTAGTVALLKRYPNFRVDVYPTHRSISYSEAYLDTCKGNAVSAKMTADGNGIEGSPHGCVPFPIPHSGIEVIWNNLLSNKNGVSSDMRFSNYLVDSTGNPTDVGHTVMDYAQPYKDPQKNAPLQDGISLYSICTWDGPPSQVGTKLLTQYSMNFDKMNTRVWIYTPGQRRTRLAPEFTYDTPVASVGGAENYDESYGFAGEPDLYNFKLVGKKEIYVPYNENRLMFAPMDKVMAGTVLNPDLSRWELHRVWVVEATLKDGKRHVQPRRTFYVDEDSWAIVMSDAYDAAGKMAKVGVFPIVPIWNAHAFIQGNDYYDLNRQMTTFSMWNRPDDYVKFSSSVDSYAPYTAAAITSSGIR